MTANQIAYWNLQEQKRANKAKEEENLRSNQAKEFNQLIGNLDSLETWAAFLGLSEDADAQEILKRLSKSIFKDSPIGGLLEGISHNASKPFDQIVVEEHPQLPTPVNPNVSGIYSDPTLMPGYGKRPWS